MFLHFLWNQLSLFGDVALDRLRRALANFPAVQVHSGHAGLRGKGNEDRIMRSEFAAAEPVFFLGQDDDRAALRGLVGERSELRGAGQFSVSDAGSGVKRGRFAIAKCDGAGLVEEQHVHVAGGFHGAPGHRNHVALDQAIHAGDPDGGEQSANRRGNQANKQRNQREDTLRRARINRERLQCDDGQKKNNGEPGEQDVQRDFVRSLLSRGAFDKADHPVEKGLTRVRGDTYFDFIGKHPRASGNGGAIASGFANHWCGFAGNRGFIHRSDAFNHFAVAGNEFAGSDNDHITGAKFRAGQHLRRSIFVQLARFGLGAGFAQSVRLSLPAPLSHGFGKVGKQNREPQPKRDLQPKSEIAVMLDEIGNQNDKRDDRAGLDDKHDWIFDHQAGIKFPE